MASIEPRPGAMTPFPVATDPSEIPDILIVRLARDRDPNSEDDLADLLFDTGAPAEITEQAIARAVAAGYLEYTDQSGDSINAVPTAAGHALLVEKARHELSVALEKAAEHDATGGW